MRAIDRPPRRPEPAPDGHAGRPSRRAPTDRPSHMSSARRDDAVRTGACSSRRRGDSIPRVNAFMSEVFYDDRLESHPTHRRSSASMRATRPIHRAPVVRWLPIRHTGDATTVARRGRARRRPRPPLVQGGSRGSTRRTGRARSAGRRASSSRRTTPRSRTIRSRCRPRRAERRHRRQVPGPGGVDQHLLDGDLEPARLARAAWTSCTAATGSTSPRREPRCISVVAMSPDLLEAGARTPEQMRLANALCRYVELASDAGARLRRRYPPSA